MSMVKLFLCPFSAINAHFLQGWQDQENGVFRNWLYTRKYCEKEGRKKHEKKDIEDYEMGRFDFAGSCCCTDGLEFYLQAGRAA